MSWHDCTLGEVVRFQRGHDLPDQNRKPGDVPVIGSAGLTGWHNEPRARGPGVSIGRSGASIGKVTYTPTDYWPHNACLYVTDFLGNNPRFVYYYLKTKDFSSLNSGAAQPSLNRNFVHAVPARIAELPAQQNIVGVLSAYDDLIENNRRRIALLEKSARMIFREWFVRFRFPAHEHIKIIDGVPTGWERRYLADVVSTQYGHTAAAEDEPIGPKFLRGTDINKKTYIDWSDVPYCSEHGLDFDKYALRPGDILVIRMADPGKVALVEKPVCAVFASYLVRLKVHDPHEVPPLFLFQTLLDDRYQGFIAASSGGSTRKTASAPLLTDFHFVLPPKLLLELYLEQVEPVRELITKLTDQSASAVQARDLLLPRLMNGEITV